MLRSILLDQWSRYNNSLINLNQLHLFDHFNVLSPWTLIIIQSHFLNHHFNLDFSFIKFQENMDHFITNHYLRLSSAKLFSKSIIFQSISSFSFQLLIVTLKMFNDQRIKLTLHIIRLQSFITTLNIIFSIIWLFMPF